MSETPSGTFVSTDRGVTTMGFGGRVGYNVNRHLALEAEASYLPKKNFNEVFQSRRTQVLAGLKAGRRWEKVGVFAKARPGAMFFSEYGMRGVCTFTPGRNECFDQSRVFFATDVGGVVEYYPTPRAILRLDAGDTIIRFRDAGPVVFPGGSVFTRRETTHNFQLSLGLGFRF